MYIILRVDMKTIVGKEIPKVGLSLHDTPEFDALLKTCEISESSVKEWLSKNNLGTLDTGGGAMALLSLILKKYGR
jgi:hypothetical protein